MDSTTFLQRAVRPRSFEFAWLCGGSLFLGITAMLAIAYGVAANGGFRWETKIDNQSLSAADYNRVQQTRRGDQCEVLHAETPVMERQNTWSNLAYLLVGLVIVCRWPTLTGGFFGIYLIILAFFSGLYHASNSSQWQTRDVAGIYAAFVALVTFAMDSMALRFFPRSWKTFKAPFGSWPVWRFCRFVIGIAWIVVGPTVLGGFMAANRKEICVFESTTAFILFVCLLLALIFSSLFTYYSSATHQDGNLNFLNDNPDTPPPTGGTVSSNKKNWLERLWDWLCYSFWGILALEGGVAIAAFVPRLGDGQGKPFCSPDCWVQAHAVWHVLSAGALLVGYEIFVRIGGMRGRLLGRTRQDMPS